MYKFTKFEEEQFFKFLKEWSDYCKTSYNESNSYACGSCNYVGLCGLCPCNFESTYAGQKMFLDRTLPLCDIKKSKSFLDYKFHVCKRVENCHYCFFCWDIGSPKSFNLEILRKVIFSKYRPKVYKLPKSLV